MGRPNAGKSTLLNAVLGQKLAGVSPRPQTTRNRIAGIVSAEGMQVVLVDTPGIHKARSRINKAMVELAQTAMLEADAITLMVDAAKAVDLAKAKKPVLDRGMVAITGMIQESGVAKILVVLNKVDLVDKGWLLPVIQVYAERFPGAEVLPISARKEKGLDQLLEAWARQLPEGPPLFPAEQLTDMSERFVIGEFIREKVFRATRQEVPYGTAVDVERVAESEHGNGKVEIFARIIVERDSQKGILIGKKGQMLKHIGTEARQDIQRLLGVPVHLELHVSVAKDWTENPRILREQGIE